MSVELHDVLGCDGRCFYGRYAICACICHKPPARTLEDVIKDTIEAEPHHRRLYPELYAADVAAAVESFLEASR